MIATTLRLAHRYATAEDAARVAQQENLTEQRTLRPGVAPYTFEPRSLNSNGKQLHVVLVRDEHGRDAGYVVA